MAVFEQRRPEQDLRHGDPEPDRLSLGAVVRHDRGREGRHRDRGQGHAPRLQDQEPGKPYGE